MATQQLRSRALEIGWPAQKEGCAELLQAEFRESWGVVSPILSVEQEDQALPFTLVCRRHSLGATGAPPLTGHTPAAPA